MSQFLLYYQRPNPATWVYLSSFLTIGLYFVFHRFWSIRNLDILLLILLGPGLLLVHEGRKQELSVQSEAPSAALVSRNERLNDFYTGGATLGQADYSTVRELSAVRLVSATQPAPDAAAFNPTDRLRESARGKQLRGFVWLFIIEVAILLRLLFDPMMVRRPLLDPNLTTGGLVFIGVSMLVFLMANVVTSTPEIQREQGPSLGPGYPVLNMLPAIPTTPDSDSLRSPRRQLEGGDDAGRVSRLNSLEQRGEGIVKQATETILTSNFVGDVEGRPTQSSLAAATRSENRPENQLEQTKARPSEGEQFIDETRRANAASASEFKAAEENRVAYVALARTLAIAAHLAVIFGITMIGYHHFGNFKAGAGCAALYLLLPYTAQMTGRVDHVLPAALLVWAILMYRRPLVAGVCLGLAAGLVYYPAFLLPLWLGFYRQRGLGRFAGGVAASVALLTILLSLGGSENFKERLIQMYGLWLPWIDNLEGVWGLGWQPIWRLPVLVAFVLLAGSYSFWPRQKNLGSLMSCSAALMVAAQFWHGFGGGLFIAWFLPLFLLTIFRPNLEDRVALKVIGVGSSRRPASGRLDASAA